MNISTKITVLSKKKIEDSEFHKIMEAHEKWLDDPKTGKRANLNDADLSNMDLSGMNFAHAYMQGVNFHNAKLVGSNLSNVIINGACISNADLSNAIIENTVFMLSDLFSAKLDGCKGNKAFFDYVCMWDCSLKNAELKNASFFGAEACDCDFSGSDLEDSCFVCADLDNTRFDNANLKNADMSLADRTYWSSFKNADMTGSKIDGIELHSKNLEGVKGLYIPIYCPEEGSFIAWKKCREGKVVKLMIPEHAKRKGTSLDACRASEAVVLEIYDKDGKTTNEAVSIIDEDFTYEKGKTVIPKELNPRFYGDVSGIYFVLSRAETKKYSEI